MDKNEPKQRRSKFLEALKQEDDKETKDERRRRRKELRRAQKLTERFAALGLDEFGHELDNFSILKYPVREYHFNIPGTQEKIALNPVVTLIAVVGLWGIVAWTSCTCGAPVVEGFYFSKVLQS
jgi:hypothetical protein